MDITDMFTNITPLTIKDAEVRILLAEALDCDVSKVDDEYLTDDCHTLDAPPANSRTLDECDTRTFGAGPERQPELAEVRERHLRLVPEPEYGDNAA